MTIHPIAVVLTGFSAVAIALAPVAQAEGTSIPAPTSSHQHIAPAPLQCQTMRAGSMCTSPGNAQINDAPPPVQNFPMYGFMPWIL